jgi:transposase
MRWRALLRYIDDGRVELDNNSAERALRAGASGRKKYLFAESDSGGDRAAAMYTLIGTAKLNDLDPETYPRTVLNRIADPPHPPHPRTAALEPTAHPLLTYVSTISRSLGL